MRKRWIALGISLLAILLALGLFLYLRAIRRETEPASAYQMDFVANTHREIPAPVYAQPSETAEILFYYYNNAVIHVQTPPLKALPEPWVKVRIYGTEETDTATGSFVTGYMVKSQLAGQSGQKHLYDGRPHVISTGRDWKLFDEPSLWSNSQRMPSGLEGYLLGYSEDWWHVGLYDDQHSRGYVSIAQNAMVHYANAWIEAGGPKQHVVLRAEPKEEGRAVGTMYHGAVLQYLCTVEDGRWAEVCFSNTWSHRVYGYLKQDELVLDPNSNHSYDPAIFPKARVQVPEGADELAFREEPSLAALGEYGLKQGQEVSIYGTVGDFSLISDGNCSGYVLSQYLESF